MKSRNNTASIASKKHRGGNVLMLTCFMLVTIFGLLAFAVDLGIAYSNRAEMQRTADAAALAAVSSLLEQRVNDPMAGTYSDALAKAEAAAFAAQNAVGRVSPALADADVEVGVLTDANDPASLIMPGFGLSSTARVTVRRDAALNGETPFFFGQLFGIESVPQYVRATATYKSNFNGFQVASDQSNLGILPFALDEETYLDMMNYETSDDFTWDPETQTISAGGDGIPEANLFPGDYGMPGNRGTVDIGHSGNSTNDIKRQILEGISPSDLAHHGGKLEFDENGVMILNGDTGISAAVKTQLNIVKGKPRIIPIFVDAAGNGNNANYTINRFVGIRIMDVKLTGSMKSKRVVVQPAIVSSLGAIQTTETSHTSFIFSPVGLVK